VCLPLPPNYRRPSFFSDAQDRDVWLFSPLCLRGKPDSSISSPVCACVVLPTPSCFLMMFFPFTRYLPPPTYIRMGSSSLYRRMEKRYSLPFNSYLPIELITPHTQMFCSPHNNSRPISPSSSPCWAGGMVLLEGQVVSCPFFASRPPLLLEQQSVAVILDWKTRIWSYLSSRQLLARATCLPLFSSFFFFSLYTIRQTLLPR